MAEEKIATRLKDRLPGFSGHAALYELNPPLVEEREWDEEEPRREHRYVVASATYVMFSGPETYLFPADEHGTVTSWSELPGSFKGDLDHAEALERAGYRVGVPA